MKRGITEIVISRHSISINLAITKHKTTKANLGTHRSYINSVPCNEAKVGCACNFPFNLSASARKAHPFDEISPGTTYASENSEKY